MIGVSGCADASEPVKNLTAIRKVDHWIPLHSWVACIKEIGMAPAG